MYNNPKKGQVGMGNNTHGLQKGDKIIIKAHNFQSGQEVLRRPSGLYAVLFVFASGNIFGLWLDGHTGYPQVIEQKQVVGKVTAQQKAA